MFPLLLLLLVPQSVADPGTVCLNISESTIKISTAYADIVDECSNTKCNNSGNSCLISCTFSNKTVFNGSSVCLDADVTTSIALSVYEIQDYANCSIYLCNERNILTLMDSLHSNSSDMRGIMQLFKIGDSCVELINSKHELKKAYMMVEKQMIHNIMGTSYLQSGCSIIYDLKALSLNVVNVSDIDLSTAGTRIQIEAPQLLPENKPFVPETWLPVDALRSIPKEQRIIGLVSYKKHSHFQFEQEMISSMVLRIELLGEQHLHNLQTSVQMMFRVISQVDLNNESWLMCHYFDEKEARWKTNGCKTDNDDNTNIICNCDHATPFAVLLIREQISELHWTILSYISYIGCGLSAFFMALSLVMYIFSRHHRRDHSISIHVSLSGALFMLNATFLLTEWGTTVKPDWVCVFVAALMHYSLLCSFTWMAIEALHLYLLLIKVFNTYYKHYLLKLSLAGWGIPGVIVAVSLGVKDFKQFYGVTQMSMSDTNQTNAICWITDDSFFYSVNLVYFTLIFVFNSGILMAVASSICKMKQAYRSDMKLGGVSSTKRFSTSCRSGLIVLGLTCLMGTTWGLAFLGSGYVNYAILYLFCIFNSIQGFFIFLWICLSVQKQKNREVENRTASTPVKTLETKAD